MLYSAAAKSLQSCPTPCDRRDGSPAGSSVPGIFPGKNAGVGCHCLLQCMKGKGKMKSFIHVRLLGTPWTAAHQAPPSMGFSRQEHWNGLPLLYSRFSLVVYFIHSINSVYTSIPTSQFHPPHLPFPTYPYICSLRLCLYFCFANNVIYTMFF